MPTFESVWRNVLLQAPDVPPMTARKFVGDVYLRLLGQRGWNFLRAETSLTPLASRAVTAGVTQGLTAITSAAEFVATDQGRQFRIGSGDTFTIQTFTDASTAVLDRPYTGTTDAAASATILDAYVTMPADFGRFDTILDTVAQRRMPWWASQDEINGLDPLRTTSGTPRTLSAITPSSTGLMRYEYWPRPANAAVYPVLYYRRASIPADTDLLVGVFAERPDVIEAGALVSAARYPGTADRPNAYFNLALARDLDRDFQALAQQVDLRDDDLAPQDYVPDGKWTNTVMWDYAMNLKTLRQTDAGIGDALYSW